MKKPLALIVGAAGTVGRAAMEELRKEYRLVATSRSGAKGLPTLCSQDIALPLDALNEASWLQVIEQLPRAPQLVVHCVGDFLLEPLDQVTPDRFDAVVESNLSSAFRTYYHMAPLLRQSTQSGLLYFGLAHGQAVQSEPRISAYYAAKQGLKSLVKSIAAQEAQNGMSCHLIALGFVAGSPQPTTTQQAPVPVEQLRAAIGHLTGPLAQQLSGTILDLSGGWRLR